MSLFKARDWWRVSCGQHEEFDKGSLCIGNVDNSSDGRGARSMLRRCKSKASCNACMQDAAWHHGIRAVKVIVGSFQGLLRIYQPREREYKVEDLLLEVELEQAILQLEAGRFSSCAAPCNYAPLCPLARPLSATRLCCCKHGVTRDPRLRRNGGVQLAVLHPRKLVTYAVQATASAALSLTKLYEHFLEHTAANMTVGSFGGIPCACNLHVCDTRQTKA
jgi:Bardet-Biedl syndrome 9 protein